MPDQNPVYRYKFDARDPAVTVVTRTGSVQQIVATGREFEIPHGHEVEARFEGARAYLSFMADGRFPLSAAGVPRVVAVDEVKGQDPEETQAPADEKPAPEKEAQSISADEVGEVPADLLGSPAAGQSGGSDASVSPG